MKHLFLFIFLFIPVFAIAQVNLEPYSISEEVKYVYLNNDSLITGTELYKEQFEGKDYIYLDGKTYPILTVKFYKNEYGLFANTTQFYTNGLFAEASEIGKLNLFELNHEVSIPIKNEFGEFQSMPKNSNYYNIGFGDLKRANYANLVIDLEDNTSAMLHLDKYNSVRKNQNILYIVSGVFAIGAIASLTNDSDISLGLGVGSALVSAASITTAFAIGFNKKKHLQNAIQAYNF